MQFLKLYLGIITSLALRICLVNTKYQCLCYVSQSLDCEDGEAVGVSGA